jgi:hypothetical protein
MESPDKTAAGP